MPEAHANSLESHSFLLPTSQPLAFYFTDGLRQGIFQRSQEVGSKHRKSDHQYLILSCMLLKKNVMLIL